MKKFHTTPCAECPWRKDSLQGWTGGWPVEGYADAVASNVIPACHCRDDGPEHPNTAFCAGAASVMENACILPTEFEPGQEGAREMVKATGPRDDTFAHPAKFYEYHAGKPYVAPILRRLQGASE